MHFYMDSIISKKFFGENFNKNMSFITTGSGAPDSELSVSFPVHDCSGQQEMKRGCGQVRLRPEPLRATVLHL